MSQHSLPSALVDPIRSRTVEGHPEERVRQRLLQHMLVDCGFPRACIAVERELGALPHLRSHRQRGKLPRRRIDLLSFAQGIHPLWPLYPLIIIECKAGRAEVDALHQVRGYNHFVGAYFLAVADSERLLFAAACEEKVVALSALPSFQELVDAIRR